MVPTALGAYAIWLVVWYWQTIVSMVTIWYRSETYVHGFLIFPIAGWLVWRRRKELAALQPEPGTSWLPIAAMLAAGVLWLAGDLADVLAARHLAWITLLIAGVWWLVGDRIARLILFPLGFLYLAVPMGEFMLPTLMDWTADFTVAALRASGVPVLRDGTTFQIPTGSWSVVEACSGLRYLIASLTVGVLYAYLTYRTLARRLAFVVAAILVPIVANWMRAYMIVMIGHLSGNKLAVGVDHIIYGWVFFGLVMMLLFWIGNFWREDTAPRQPRSSAATPARQPGLSVPASGLERSRPNRHAGAWSPVLAVAFLIAVAAPIMVWLSPGNPPYGAVQTAPPVLGNWHPIAGPLIDWTPDFLPARAEIASTYVRGDDRAALYVAMYYDQDRESKLVSSANQLIRTTNHSGYMVSSEPRTLDLPQGSLTVNESVLRIGNQRVLARTWFWVNGRLIGSPVRAKIAQALARLRGVGDAGAIVVVYALVPAEGGPESAALDDLTRAAAKVIPGLLTNRLKAGLAP
jgi:exosortase A